MLVRYTRWLQESTPGKGCGVVSEWFWERYGFELGKIQDAVLKRINLPWRDILAVTPRQQKNRTGPQQKQRNKQVVKNHSIVFSLNPLHVLIRSILYYRLCALKNLSESSMGLPDNIYRTFTGHLQDRRGFLS